MSQSPPGALYGQGGEMGAGAEAEARALSAGSRSLGAPSPSPRLARSKFGSTPSAVGRVGGQGGARAEPPSPRAARPARRHLANPQYLVAVHRKQVRQEAYFLASQRCQPALFGRPLLVGVAGAVSGRDLYAAVWTQVRAQCQRGRCARAQEAGAAGGVLPGVAALPAGAVRAAAAGGRGGRRERPRPVRRRVDAGSEATESKASSNDQANHATDCDDSLGYEFPFTLRVVGASGVWCAVCPWLRLCRGCALVPTARPLLRSCESCASHDGFDSDDE
ncbi:hypothetical protein ACJJTC_005158, partial [Scirpophaga incertulas]